MVSFMIIQKPSENVDGVQTEINCKYEQKFLRQLVTMLACHDTT